MCEGKQTFRAWYTSVTLWLLGCFIHILFRSTSQAVFIWVPRASFLFNIAWRKKNKICRIPIQNHRGNPLWSVLTVVRWFNFPTVFLWNQITYVCLSYAGCICYTLSLLNMSNSPVLIAHSLQAHYPGSRRPSVYICSMHEVEQLAELDDLQRSLTNLSYSMTLCLCPE